MIQPTEVMPGQKFKRWMTFIQSHSMEYARHGSIHPTSPWLLLLFIWLFDRSLEMLTSNKVHGSVAVDARVAHVV